MAVGKACEKAGTPRAKMSIYMETLRKKTGYISLKIKHAEKQAKMFPSILGFTGELSSEAELGNLWSMEEREASDDPLLLLNPIEERDMVISKQKKKIEELMEEKRNNSELEQNMVKVTAEKEKLEGMNEKYVKKLDFARKITERKILETVSNDEFYREDPHLITVLSTTLVDDDLVLEEAEDDSKEEDDTSNEARSRKGKFLEDIESKLDRNNAVHIERLNHVKTQVLDHLKLTKRRKNRTRTDSKRKQIHDKDYETEEHHSSRPRTFSPKQ